MTQSVSDVSHLTANLSVLGIDDLDAGDLETEGSQKQQLDDTVPMLGSGLPVRFEVSRRPFLTFFKLPCMICYLNFVLCRLVLLCSQLAVVLRLILLRPFIDHVFKV